MILTVIKIIAFIIFCLSCITIYHNTNSYEPTKRIIYIIVRKHCNVCDNCTNLQYEYRRTTSKE